MAQRGRKVAILDADKEGFLRSETSLIQTIGRAARNADGMVILYADTITPSMRRAMDETERRRAKQDAFNQEHGIVPKTIIKSVRDVIDLSEEKGELPHSKQALSKKEREAAIAEDKTGEGFIYEMFLYELDNHEYGYTMDTEETLDTLGYTADEVLADPRLKRGIEKAVTEICGRD